MMNRILAMAAALALALVVVAPAGAVTDGEPDAGEHPAVGQLLFFVPDAVDPNFNDPGAWFNCSGTLLSDTVVLTAGHCTFGIGSGGTDVWVNFDEVPTYDGFPSSGDYGPNDNALRNADRLAWVLGEADWRRGTATPHPDYVDASFFLADAGVVVLDVAVSTSDVPASEYGVLPTEGFLDQFATRRGPNQRFTPVGYGLETGFPTFEGGDTRMKAEVMLVSLNGAYGLGGGTSVVFSGNPGRHATGGTCFGDSGGPVFEGTDSRTIVAVSSFGITFNCVEPGGYYRIDQADDLDFINDFLP